MPCTRLGIFMFYWNILELVRFFRKFSAVVRFFFNCEVVYNTLKKLDYVLNCNYEMSFSGPKHLGYYIIPSPLPKHFPAPHVCHTETGTTFFTPNSHNLKEL
jgi:hypothetical protein